MDSTQKVLFRIMQSFKRHTARQANIILSRTGKKFWHAESFDYRIRNEVDLAQKITYTLNNPVKAKLVKDWKNWEYSYIHPAFEPFILEQE